VAFVSLTHKQLAIVAWLSEYSNFLLRVILFDSSFSTIINSRPLRCLQLAKTPRHVSELGRMPTQMTHKPVLLAEVYSASNWAGTIKTNRPGAVAF